MADGVDAAVANKLQVGRMAEFNRIFMQVRVRFVSREIVCRIESN
jgi:hypothetical protein